MYLLCITDVYYIYMLYYICPKETFNYQRFFGSKITTTKSLDETKNPHTSGTK